MEIKIENIYILPILALLFLSCNNKIKEDNHDLFLAEKIKNEKSFNDGSYYKYVQENDSVYKIEWGNKSFKNLSKNSFDFLGNGKFNFLKKGDKSIVLSQSCGTSCTQYLVLPIFEESQEKLYMQAIAVNVSNNLVVFISENGSFFTIENYLTGKKKDYFEKNLCPSALKIDCIDSVYFKGSNFFIEWQGNKWTNNKTDPQRKNIQIDLKEFK